MLPLAPVRKAAASAAGVGKHKSRYSEMSQHATLVRYGLWVSELYPAVCAQTEEGRGVIPDCVDWAPAGKLTGGQWITALELFREMRQCPLVDNGF